uniref:Uncharacterized protein n=1 Tax=Rhizophora mucronata TaxID=61149 RepID=A0A2P2Q9V0_RHIMU
MASAFPRVVVFLHQDNVGIQRIRSRNDRASVAQDSLSFSSDGSDDESVLPIAWAIKVFPIILSTCYAARCAAITWRLYSVPRPSRMIVVSFFQGVFFFANASKYSFHGYISGAKNDLE